MVSKEKKLEVYRISFRGFKANHGMLTVKIFEVVYVKYVYYSTRIWGRNREINLTLTVFQDVGKSEKIIKHESKEHHKDALEKAKDFLKEKSTTKMH